MLNAKQIHEMEQATAVLAEVLPSACGELFRNFRNQGFTNAQAFALVQTWLLSQGNGAVEFPDAPSPEDKPEK